MPRNAKVADRSGRAWLRVELDPGLKADVLKAAIDERTTLQEFTAQALAERVARIRAAEKVARIRAAEREANSGGDSSEPTKLRRQRRRG